jgi:hypothetical protein
MPLTSHRSDLPLRLVEAVEAMLSRDVASRPDADRAREMLASLRSASSLEMPPEWNMLDMVLDSFRA